MDIAVLRTFLAVANAGSLSGGARTERYTQSAVSRQIAALEAELDVALFERLPRGVLLTEHGRTFVPYAEAIVEQNGAARRALGEIGAGHLRLGAFPTAIARLVPVAIRAFREQHPDLLVTLVEGTTDRHLNRLRDGEIDMAIVSADADRRVRAPALQFDPLTNDSMLVALPRDHRFSNRRTLRLRDLRGETWVAGARDPDLTLLAGASPTEERPQIDLVIEEWTAKLGLVASGLAITLVPGLAATAVRNDVVLVPLINPGAPRRHVYVATRRGGGPPASADLFDELKKSAAALRRQLPAAAQGGS